MSVDINRLGTAQLMVEYRETNTRMVGVLDRIATGKRAATAKTDPLLWRDSQELAQYSELLTGFSDNLNRGAASVRVALSSMEASRQHLLQLEEKLNAAFAEPPGTAARAENLREYNDLHRYINDTARAPDAGARRLLEDPQVNPEAGDIEVRAGENGFSLLLRSREIHAGATGLNVPRAGEALPSALEADPAALPVIADLDNASNEEIKAMIAHLEAAKANLTAKTKALAVDATAIEDAQNFNTAFITRNKSQADQIIAADLNAEAVLAQSLQIKNSLALNGLAGLKDTHKLALNLLQAS